MPENSYKERFHRLDNHIERKLLFTLIGQLEDDISYEKVIERYHHSQYYLRKSCNPHKNFWYEFIKSAPFDIMWVVKTTAANIFLWNRKHDDGDIQDQKIQWGILFFEDNNIVLDRIRRYGGQINYFIGIKDGCGEGGNYQCVNEPPFLNKVLDCMADVGMTYITDHGFSCTHDEFWRYFPEYYPNFSFTHQSFTDNNPYPLRNFSFKKILTEICTMKHRIKVRIPQNL